MEKLIKYQIDGKKAEAPAGMNLIDAAELSGVHIPNLCYLKGMKGIGACRLCLVEVEGLKAPVIACNTKLKEGMVINTKTEKVQEVRKFVKDLILSMHPLDCMTCTKAGVCNLQKYAYDFELKESTFTRKKSGYPTDEANPFIKRDPEYCVLCGRCVRVCKEQGTNVLDFMGRGIESKVVTANDRPLQESECTFCGSCVDACPVNALLESDRWRKGREWEYEKTNSVCLLCGNGCDIRVSTKDGRVQNIKSGAEAGSAEKYICAYGRFGFDCIEAETRLTVPMKRADGELKETTWQDALSIVARKMKDAGKDAGFISVAGIMNEDALAMKRLAKDVVKTKHFDTTLSLYADSGSLKKSQKADIDAADLIILVGLNPSQWDRILPAL
jgi:NADH dehydrogenase/NADH:ubiquinone oxidoreductase subunit G